MRSYAFSGMVLAAAVFIAAPSFAETLNNDAVRAMVQAGLPDEVIVAKVKSSESAFDVSTAQIIQLKQEGVSGPVVAAMVDRAALASRPALSLDSADPAVPHPSGVYLLQSWLPEPKMQRIDATVSNQAKTGGILGYAFTAGIASMSIKASIQNETARTKVLNGRPQFFMFFDESNPDSASSSWLSGASATVTSPNELTLIRLTKKDGRREARVGSMNIAGAKTGVMDKDRLDFDYVMVRPGVFRIEPKADLGSGEYGFIYALTSGGGAGGALTARVFDFSVN